MGSSTLNALVVVAFDQWTKDLIKADIPLNGEYVPFPALRPYFKLVHWPNTGAAFGFLRQQGSLLAVVTVVVIIAVLIYVRYLPVDSWAVRLCLGLQLGGGMGGIT